jgi:HEAT repeats
MKARFPGFKKCMAMMRKHDPQMQEDGFHWLEPHAGEHVHELIEEFGKEKSHGLRCWLIELIGAAKSPDAFEFLAKMLRSDDEGFRFWAILGLKKLGTKEARTLLWQAHSFTLASPEETEAFRSDLNAVLNKFD